MASNSVLDKLFRSINNKSGYVDLPQYLVLQRGYDPGLILETGPKHFKLKYGPDFDAELHQKISQIPKNNNLEDLAEVFKRPLPGTMVTPTVTVETKTIPTNNIDNGGANMANTQATQNPSNANTGVKSKKLTDMYAKLKTGMGNLGSYIKSNPAMSAGLAGTGLANVAGLLDNDYVGGQLTGLAGGGALGQFLLPQLMSSVSPQAKVLTALGGGTLGALFDSLRQKKAEENAQMAYMQNMNQY